MSTWEEEKERGPGLDQKRLRELVAGREEALAGAEAARVRAEETARRWRQKVVALSENYRKRIRQLTEWTERLGRERAALEKERRRLERENADLVDRLTRRRRDALAGFLGHALEDPVDRERVRRLATGEEGKRRILSLLSESPPDERDLAARTG